jgi:hypothetical protein
LPFDKNFEPQNPLIDLFSPTGGSYLVKPSQLAIDNWFSQTQVFTYASGTSTAAAVLRDNFPFDTRAFFTYQNMNGQPVIMKYLYNYLDVNGNPINTFNKSGKWFLMRAASNRECEWIGRDEIKGAAPETQTRPRRLCYRAPYRVE